MSPTRDTRVRCVHALAVAVSNYNPISAMTPNVSKRRFIRIKVTGKQEYLHYTFCLAWPETTQNTLGNFCRSKTPKRENNLAVLL